MPAAPRRPSILDECAAECRRLAEGYAVEPHEVADLFAERIACGEQPTTRDLLRWVRLVARPGLNTGPRALARLLAGDSLGVPDAWGDVVRLLRRVPPPRWARLLRHPSRAVRLTVARYLATRDAPTPPR